MLVALSLLACLAPRPGNADVNDDENPSDGASTSLRVATWNVEGLGRDGTADNEAVRAILQRIDADIVGLNEIEPEDATALKNLAEDLGYELAGPSSNPFGDLRNAILSRLPISSSAAPTSAQLSSDNDANDVTRWPVRVVVDVSGREVVVVAQHWKSGFDDVDEFRRAVDATRTAQAADIDGDVHVVMGDVNAEFGDGESPGSFSSLPNYLPSSYWLGSDLYAAMEGGGLENDAFSALQDLGLTPVDALQVDGRTGTRWVSERRIDYVFIDDGATVLASEVYDSRDEHVGDGIDKGGEAPERSTSEAASDHLPVVVDLTIP
jgi:endonuclease/exonuclease/phosphatase family metal-dependent hydrolase